MGIVYLFLGGFSQRALFFMKLLIRFHRSLKRIRSKSLRMLLAAKRLLPPLPPLVAFLFFYHAGGGFACGMDGRVFFFLIFRSESLWLVVTLLCLSLEAKLV